MQQITLSKKEFLKVMSNWEILEHMATAWGKFISYERSMDTLAAKEARSDYELFFEEAVNRMSVVVDHTPKLSNKNTQLLQIDLEKIQREYRKRFNTYSEVSIYAPTIWCWSTVPSPKEIWDFFKPYIQSEIQAVSANGGVLECSANHLKDKVETVLLNGVDIPDSHYNLNIQFIKTDKVLEAVNKRGNVFSSLQIKTLDDCQVENVENLKERMEKHITTLSRQAQKVKKYGGNLSNIEGQIRGVKWALHQLYKVFKNDSDTKEAEE